MNNVSITHICHTALFILGLILFQFGMNGCKEGCDGIVCAPAPPLLQVRVSDTVTMQFTVRVADTVTADPLDSLDVIVDSVVVRPTGQAVVTLYRYDSDQIGSEVVQLQFNSGDSLYSVDNTVDFGSGEFAFIASREGRSDTTTGLNVDRVEGCCGYSVIGSYRITLPEE